MNNIGMYPRVVAGMVVITAIGVLLTGNVITLVVPAALALWIGERIRRALK